MFFGVFKMQLRGLKTLGFVRFNFHLGVDPHVRKLGPEHWELPSDLDVRKKFLDLRKKFGRTKKCFDI